MAGNNRMILDLAPEVQMAIKLRAVKNGVTTGAVVAEAIRSVWGADVNEAIEVLANKGVQSEIRP